MARLEAKLFRCPKCGYERIERHAKAVFHPCGTISKTMQELKLVPGGLTDE